MRKIRQHVFETNSSSLHSITVSAHEPNVHPDSIHFECGEFGWEVEEYTHFIDKASYLWTAVVHIFGEYVGSENGIYRLEGDEYQAIKEKIKKACIDYGVKDVTFQERFRGRGWSDDAGYIDHTPDRDFVDELVNDEDRLQRFLFSDDSCIATGNDNDYDGECHPNPTTQAVEWEYWKGN